MLYSAEGAYAEAHRSYCAGKTLKYEAAEEACTPPSEAFRHLSSRRTSAARDCGSAIRCFSQQTTHPCRVSACPGSTFYSQRYITSSLLDPGTHSLPLNEASHAHGYKRTRRLGPRHLEKVLRPKGMTPVPHLFLYCSCWAVYLALIRSGTGLTAVSNAAPIDLQVTERTDFAGLWMLPNTQGVTGSYQGAIDTDPPAQGPRLATGTQGNHQDMLSGTVYLRLCSDR